MKNSVHAQRKSDVRASGHAALQWNRGGWLGNQLGGSAWILVAGLLSLPMHMPAALGVIGLFTAANLAGWLLWRRRDKLSPYAGIQIMLPVLGLCGLGAVYLLQQAGVFEAIQFGASVSAESIYLLLPLIILTVMLMFYLRFGRRRRHRQSGHERNNPVGD